MKDVRAALLPVGLFALTGWIAHKAAPFLSDRIANAAIRTVHFEITSSTTDAALAKRVPAVLESEYDRVSGALGHELREPVKVRVTSSRLIYNLSCGIPVPTPLGDGFDGAAGDRGVTILLPPDWKLGEEKEIPDRGRVLAIHEITHLIIFDMNPAVLHKRWLSEGVVWYVSMGEETPAMRRLDRSWMGDDLRRGAVPRLSDIVSSNQENWQRRKGDFYGRQFVRFVAERFGTDKVPAMVRGAEDLRLVLGNEVDLYPEWLDYLKARYN